MLNIDSHFLLSFLYLVKLEVAVFNVTTAMAIFVRKQKVAGGVIVFCVCLPANVKQKFSKLKAFVCLMFGTENRREISLLRNAL